MNLAIWVLDFGPSPVKIISFGAPLRADFWRISAGFNGGQSVFIRILIYKLVIPFSVRELYNVIYIYIYVYITIYV